MTMPGQPEWKLFLDYEESEGSMNCSDVIRNAAARSSGTLYARRVNGAEELELTFNDTRAILEFGQSEEGPFFRPVFPYRAVPPSEPEEFHCGGCGIPIVWPRSETIPRKDAFALAREFLATGELPPSVPGEKDKQLILPGMEEFVLSDDEWRRVEWREIT
jgi:hypothetical protein